MRCIMLVVRYIFLSLTLLFVSISAANAAAFDAFVDFDGFDGKTINYQYYLGPSDAVGFPGPPSDTGDRTVSSTNPLPEIIDIGEDTGTMDIFNTGFFVDFTKTWTFDPNVVQNRFELTDAFNDIPDFSAFTWMLTTNTLLTMGDVTIGTSVIGVNLKGLVVSLESFIQLEVSAVPVSAVPVPAAIWLFGTALMGLVGMSRRTRAS